MLLAIDIGNTNISFGVFLGNLSIKKFDISTRNYSFNKLKKNLGKSKIEDIIVCSVVPRATVTLQKDLLKLLSIRPIIIGKDLCVPVRNLYRKPNQVGQDRLVNAYAGTLLYKAPLIIVDFGTAITFDIISSKKEYLGGMIFPGLRLSLDALVQGTALLPEVKLEKPREFIGRTTRNSMLSGLIYGVAALTDNLTHRIRAKIGKGAKIIGTGGSIDLIARYCTIDQVERNLTLKGLSLLYHNLAKQKKAFPKRCG